MQVCAQMENLDDAAESFKKLVAEVTEGKYWESIISEEDTRMKIIDRVFTEILGWPHVDIFLESNAGKDFIDYRCTIGGKNRLIIEAKRGGRDLGINASHAARYFKLNGTVFNTEAAKEGIYQAIKYCGFRSAELACVTNGRQWFIFRGARGADGTDTLDGLACTFGSLDAVIEKFPLFYELLAHESVSQFSYRALFREAEGQPVRKSSAKVSARHPDSRTMLRSEQLSLDLDRIMQSFFRDLTAEDDSEARRACFVTTNESRSAEQGLSRIAEELRDKVRSLNTAETVDLAHVIRRVREMHRHELVLLVGTKGAGKTTFIERFFEDILPTELKADCAVIRVDLSASSSNAATITTWLNEHLLEVAEQAAFTSGAPTYEEIVGMYFNEYKRWSEGHARPLYESDKTQFKIEFGRHIEQSRRERPHDYITHLLFRLAFGHHKVACLVFDNADHFDVPFQEEVFKYAHSLYLSSVCLVIVPITDTTSWQLAKQGPLQSFFTDSFFLPTPPTELVLRKRIEYIQQKVADEEPEKGRGYFFNRAIPLEIENIRAFTACLQTVFINTGEVADWIGRLCNHDIRRCLQLTREVIASPHIKAADLLKLHVDRTTVVANVDDIKAAIIRGKYDIYYNTVHSFVQNVFNFVPEIDTTPLLPCRILQFLRDTRTGNEDNDRRYALVDTIVEYFHGMNIEPRNTRTCLDMLLKSGLVLSYDPTSESIVKTVKCELAPSGEQHWMWAQWDWSYLEAMSEVTPLFDVVKAEEIRSRLGSGRPHLRRSAIRRFVQYLIAEDEHYCVIPKHDAYGGQHQVRRSFLDQAIAVDKVANIETSNRYHRLIGRITNWNYDKMFGFIRPKCDDANLFVHCSDILNAESGEAFEGRWAEYDRVATDKGEKAVDVVILKE